MSGGFVRKAGEGQGDVIAQGIMEERECFFPGGMNWGSLQLLVILCEYQLCITCAFVQGFLDTSLLSGSCALFGVTGVTLSREHRVVPPKQELRWGIFSLPCL